MRVSQFMRPINPGDRLKGSIRAAHTYRAARRAAAKERYHERQRVPNTEPLAGGPRRIRKNQRITAYF